MAADRVVGALARLLRLWRVYAYLDVLYITRNLRSFVGYYVAELVLAIGAVTGVLLLAERFDGIGDWTKPQVLFMLGYSILVSALVDVFFSFNIGFVSRRLGRGQLDHMLVQPQPLWLTFLTDGFMPFSGSVALIPGLGLMLWAVGAAAPTITVGWLVMLVVNVVASMAIVLAFSFLWGSAAFWAPRAAEEISTSARRTMTQLTPFPLDGLAPALLGGLLTIVPAGFVAWYPSRALLSLDRTAVASLVTPLAAVILVGLTAVIFLRGLAHYGRTGSQRYSTGGHRR